MTFPWPARLAKTSLDGWMFIIETWPYACRVRASQDGTPPPSHSAHRRVLRICNVSHSLEVGALARVCVVRTGTSVSRRTGAPVALLPPGAVTQALRCQTTPSDFPC